MRRNDRKGKKRLKKGRFLFGVLLLLIVLGGGYHFFTKGVIKGTQATQQSSQENSASSRAQATLPASKQSDWDLVLVNRDHMKSEMNPTTTDVDGKPVDSRIAQATQDFLSAAQQIDSSAHLVSGYRSVAYQAQLYQGYIQTEMTNRGIDEAAAEKIVQTYSQPAGASEHMTGLAIDMSTVDSLNAEPTAVAQKIQALAPQYGFILRFPDWGEESTGVDYEDWHFRYVGKENAAYITNHKITLEQYLPLLPK